MPRLLSPRIVVAIAAIAAAIVGWLLEPLDLRAFDARLRLRHDGGWPADLVGVPIDDIAQRNHGRWPWPRAVMADLLTRLRDAGATTIALDALADSPTDAADDDAFARALKPVVIALSKSMAPDEPTTAADLAPFLVPATAPGAGFLVPREIALPLPAFAAASAGVGHTISYTNPSDGMMRGHVPLLGVDGMSGSIPSLALLAIAHQRGIDPRKVEADAWQLTIPGGPPITLHYGEAFLDMVPGGATLPSIRAEDVLTAPDLGAVRAAVAGKIAVVYVDSFAHPDLHATPVGMRTPGGLIVAYGIRTLEGGRTPAPVPRALGWLIAFAAALLAAPRLARQPPARILLVTAAAIAIWSLASLVLVPALDLFLPFVSPIATLALAGLGVAAVATRTLESEKTQLKALLEAATKPAPTPEPVAIEERDTRPQEGPSKPSVVDLLSDERLESAVLLGGRYEVTKKIGRGGMGAIFYAIDRELERPVAIKVLGASERHAYQRFRREALAVARINHPNVVQIHEIGFDEEVPYIVMEYVAGGSMSDLLRHGRWPIGWKRVSRMIVAAGKGLGAAHARDIVHRDVKPANLLLTTNDGDDVKVADFGIAKLSAAGERLTREGTYVGTVGYLAPEQAMGKEVTARSDVFSLGVTWYRMLTGRHAFEGSTAEALRATLSQRVPDPRKHAPDLPEALAKVLEAMTSPDPLQRPSDGTAAASWIEAELARAPSPLAR